ncbi:MAG: hypothetical protein LBL04_05135 [Bacteroidales bacterium]|jgi:hypothetical protein|nr:hypothetical protein [Bacteroidales bacterium]
MSVFRDFLLWLEEHQTGILTTVAVHLLIISVVLVLKIRTNAEREYNIMIDLSQINANMEEEEPEEQLQQEMSTQELIQNMRQEYHVRNIPVNTAAERAVENIDKMVRDIKTEMNITDPPPPQDTPEETAPQEEKLLENEARIYEDKYPTDATGERTIYKGPTTVSYELSGRRHAWMPAPVYKCRTGGKIVVDIVVNGNGYVIAAEINKSKSDSENPCIVEAAVRDAERSRFNESSLAKQQGSITYIFQAQ